MPFLVGREYKQTNGACWQSILQDGSGKLCVPHSDFRTCFPNTYLLTCKTVQLWELCKQAKDLYLKEVPFSFLGFPFFFLTRQILHMVQLHNFLSADSVRLWFVAVCDFRSNTIVFPSFDIAVLSGICRLGASQICKKI